MRRYEESKSPDCLETKGKVGVSWGKGGDAPLGVRARWEGTQSLVAKYPLQALPRLLLDRF